MPEEGDKWLALLTSGMLVRFSGSIFETMDYIFRYLIFGHRAFLRGKTAAAEKNREIFPTVKGPYTTYVFSCVSQSDLYANQMGNRIRKRPCKQPLK